MLSVFTVPSICLKVMSVHVEMELSWFMLSRTWKIMALIAHSCALASQIHDRSLQRAMLLLKPWADNLA